VASSAPPAFGFADRELAHGPDATPYRGARNITFALAQLRYVGATD
jgi:hypothetical protein